MKSQEKSKEAESPVTCSSQPKKKFASLFCAICSEDDFDYNLHAAGSLHDKRKGPHNTFYRRVSKRFT